MKRIYYFGMTVILAIMAGCQKDEESLNIQNSLNQTFYATFENGADTRTALDGSNNVVWSEDALLYFLVLFKKQASGRFDYATKFNRKIAAEMIVKLPITEEGNIDFTFMENFIQVQKKLSIKDVVDWKDLVISKTKQII